MSQDGYDIFRISFTQVAAASYNGGSEPVSVAVAVKRCAPHSSYAFVRGIVPAPAVRLAFTISACYNA